MLNIDVCRFTAGLLSRCNNMQCEGGFTRSLGSVYLDDPALGNTADAQGKVKGERTRGKSFNINGNIVAKTHDSALAVVFLYLGNAGLKRLFLVAGLTRGGDGSLFLFSHCSSPHI